eukprot:COSAG01_NODE_5563_length_4181_cov_2.578393_7_plen_155_part_00
MHFNKPPPLLLMMMVMCQMLIMTPPFVNSQFARPTENTMYEVYRPIVTHSWVVESGKSDLKYNHDSSIALFDSTWVTVWNANWLHLEARPGQINYMATSSDRQTWTAPVPAFSGPAASNPGQGYRTNETGTRLQVKCAQIDLTTLDTSVHHIPA